MILGIGHNAFRVRDLEKSLQFYCGTLGFKEAFRLTNEKGEVWIVYLKIADNQFLELFPGGENTLQVPPNPIGYAHFCLLVDDMAATLEELAGRGLKIEGSPRKGQDGNWQYWITDPDGNRIELMQIMPDSPQANS